MKYISLLLAVSVMVSLSGSAYAADDDDSSDTLGGAVVGGLLGGGIGTAIGSISGNAGNGALWGAGIGAVGGALLGSNRNKARTEENMTAQEQQATAGGDNSVPKDGPIKKRVIKQYDEEGNLVSQKEVAG